MALVAGACYGQPLAVAAPDVPEAIRFGLFSVSEFPETSNAHWQQGVEWQPYGCGPAAVTPCPTCVQNNAFDTPEKVYEEGVELAQAFPFTVYGSFSCSPIGHWDDAVSRAIQNLKSGAERAVELEIAIGTNHGGQELTSASAVDITPTPGTAVSAAEGVALLEAYGGLNGNGRFVIMGSRRDVLLLNENGPLLYVEGNQLRTILGTPVAALSGFDGRTGPNADAAPAGEAWLFATGVPQVRRSPVFVPADRTQALNTGNNNLQILAEQTYAVGWDCFTVGVLVESI